MRTPHPFLIAVLAAGLAAPGSAFAGAGVLPPEPISPVGAVLPAGKAITFRMEVVGFFEEAKLHVSRSPRVVNRQCGSIGDDVLALRVSRSPWAPSVETTVPGVFFTAPGAYYWQTVVTDGVVCRAGPVSPFRISPPAGWKARPGTFRGRTSEGRAVELVVSRDATGIVKVETSIGMRCQRGQVRTRLRFTGLRISSAHAFPQRLEASLTSPSRGRGSALLKGSFSSPTRATGTLSDSLMFSGRPGNCAYRRVTWTARHV